MSIVAAKEASSVASVLIEVRNLSIDFWYRRHWMTVVDDVSFAVGRGEAVGLVGESGSGKTTAVYTLLGHHHPSSRIRAGSVIFRERDLLRAKPRDLQRIRGRSIGFVPQDPASALTANMRVRAQILETLRQHSDLRGSAAHTRAAELLDLVSLPADALRRYPHQLSGGQQQRVVIAIAIACNPDLLVLDEPTTGLDVTTQAQILDLLADLRRRFSLSIVYVSHDLNVIATVCDQVGVMYAGSLVEYAPRADIFARPRHPYTRSLIAAIPRIRESGGLSHPPLEGVLRRELLPPGCKFEPRCAYAEDKCTVQAQKLVSVAERHLVACRRREDPILQHSNFANYAGIHAPLPAEAATVLEIADLVCGYGQSRLFARSQPEPVVKGVSFTIADGETLALVGESGSGKSTIAKAIMGIIPPSAGRILLDGTPLPSSLQQRSRDLLREIQLIPQNPYASLNPRHRVERLIGRALDAFHGLTGRAAREQAVKLLDDVRLDASYLGRRPGQLSGGERQRVAIARALAARPRILLCDEILSALDVSVQAGVRELMRSLQVEHGMSYLFVSHDLAVVRALADSVAVLYRGEMCEIGRTNEVFAPPYHPYTLELLSAMPDAERPSQPNARRRIMHPEGARACPFADRCPVKLGSICDDQPPPWRDVSSTHRLRCHHALNELRAWAATGNHEFADPKGTPAGDPSSTAGTAPIERR
jgi:peptide/nickel transport system ATP-binding protein